MGGPMSAVAVVITKEDGARPRLFSALATADRKTLVIGSVER